MQAPRWALAAPVALVLAGVLTGCTSDATDSSSSGSSGSSSPSGPNGPGERVVDRPESDGPSDNRWECR